MMGVAPSVVWLKLLWYKVSHTHMWIYTHLCIFSLPSEPTFRVDSLRIESTDITSFTVKWNSPRVRAFVIGSFFTNNFNYTVRWFIPASTEGGELELIGEGVAVRDTSFKIENLLASTLYRVNVSVETICGPGRVAMTAQTTKNISKLCTNII